MNTDLPTWDSNRWRHAASSRQESHNGPTTSSRIQEPPQQPGPQPSGPNAVNLTSQETTLETSVLDSWIGKSRGIMDSGVCDLPRLTEPYTTTTKASAYHIQPQQRHNLDGGPQQVANTSPRETSTGPWRSLQHDDRRQSSSHTADAPLLTLQIPQPLDPQRSSTLNTPLLPNGQSYGNNHQRPAASTPSTQLPSFATFREHTNRSENAEGSKTASMLPMYHSQQQSTTPSLLSRNFSPPNPLKRPAESFTREEQGSTKRPQSEAAVERMYQPGRRGSIDFSASQPQLGRSPPPAESVPGSAHPRLASPSFGRCGTHRTLPSPSSLTYPVSATPSGPFNAAGSAGSPATSYQPSSTVHTASSTSATSQHIADLQHQVTLKSLALQTLQSEYASLLQKLQRERVKSQTIEKKTSAADQEVNDLTTKNEDLTEQVKTLEAQLEESERKREEQRQEAAREKEQWGRMLEMSGRLQNKADAEKQRLLEEKNYLTQRLMTYEEDDSQRTGEQVKRRVASPERLFLSCQPPGSDPAQHSTSTTPRRSRDHSEKGDLEQEIVSLRARVGALRTTLEDVRRHNEELEASTRGFLQQTGQLWSDVSRALDDDESQENRISQASRTVAIEPSQTRAKDHAQGAQQQNLRSPVPARQPGTLEIIKDGKKSFAKLSEVSRAKSVEPQDLGFHVPTTTSSPEELIKALGPVPTSLPPFQSAAPTTTWTTITPSSQSDKLAEPVSSFAPSLPSGYIGHHQPAETSPRSQHSSNAKGNDETSSDSPETGRRSPETYDSEPEPSTTRPTTSQSALTPVRPTLHGFHSHSFHGHSRSAEWMPPPPKPEIGYAVQASTHV